MDTGANTFCRIHFKILDSYSRVRIRPTCQTASRKRERKSGNGYCRKIEDPFHFVSSRSDLALVLSANHINRQPRSFSARRSSDDDAPRVCSGIFRALILQKTLE
jgi:hypothetical protein